MVKLLTDIKDFMLSMTPHCVSYVFKKPFLEACFDISLPADTKYVQSIVDLY
jgi:hypothetical protein